jgi:hypothetical protein
MIVFHSPSPGNLRESLQAAHFLPPKISIPHPLKNIPSQLPPPLCLRPHIEVGMKTGKQAPDSAPAHHKNLADALVLEAEHRPNFLKVIEDLTEEYRPATPMERHLVETLAAATWRTTRAWNLQRVSTNQDVAISHVDGTFLRVARTVEASSDALRRYEMSFHSQLIQTARLLTVLQDRRISRIARAEPLRKKTGARTPKPEHRPAP